MDEARPARAVRDRLEQAYRLDRLIATSSELVIEGEPTVADNASDAPAASPVLVLTHRGEQMTIQHTSR